MSRSSLLQRSSMLLLMAVKSPLYRLRHDLGREIVVMVSSVIFIGTFLYVFEDFLNVQVRSLSPKLRWWIAATLQTTLSIGTSLGVGLSLWRQHRDLRGLEAVAHFLGEDVKAISVFRQSWGILVGGLSFGLVGFIGQHWLVPLDIIEYLFAIFAMTVFAWFTFGSAGFLSHRSHLLARLRPGPIYQKRSLDQVSTAPQTPVQAMTRFRTLQLYHGKPQLRWGILLSQGIVAFAAPVCLALTHSGFLAGIGGLLAGLILSTWFAAFIAEDLGQTWTEKGSGVHHNDYLKTLEILSWRLIRWPTVFSLLLTFLVLDKAMGVVQGKDLSTFLNNVIAVLPAAVTGALGVLLLPWVVLQIDGKKPAIPLMTVTIVGLFVSSAMLAHPLGIVLVPLIRNLALNYQQGRFYRS